MIVDADGNVAGSVSGGCIEGAVIDEALRVLKTGMPHKVSFGVDDEKAWTVGLSCGGEVSVWVEPHWMCTGRAGDAEAWGAVETAVHKKRPVVMATRLDAAAPSHLAVDPEREAVGSWEGSLEAVLAGARESYKRRTSVVMKVEDADVFYHVMPRPDLLLIVGAGHIAVHLVSIAKELGFECVVIDPRRIFANNLRFPVPPDRMLTGWPEEVMPEIDLHNDTYSVLLTHDPKIDDSALHILLRSPVVYVGALGSRKTHTKRRERLQESGFDKEEISRIRGPVGLSIGAASPAEIAVSIMAEIIATKRKRAG
jgi:xanthine dehydrogenase accessory factor